MYRSTYLRYAINRMLAKFRAVCVIDCDVGQPEFTVSGLLSLHVITEPVLTASHLHLKQPLLAYYTGDLTSKSEPALTLRCVERLYSKYLEFLQASKESVNRVQAGNSFGSLQNSEYDKEGGNAAIPLLVNTDGNIRSIGSELLGSIIRLVGPTHVVHITSVKDQGIPVLDTLISAPEPQAQPFLKLSVEPGRVTASRVAAMDLRLLR